ncbi:MAG: endonuclease/exonuclease/phosphatase family protein [Saprospiraceae bacterium]|jgi:endonuclease/exonuclease/phosphatase family metal-dependent hydrolase|nr:endonuclease/exonuclease/phosphatase family protein [Candidatus Defluviibacterium haderslevense]MCC7027229.1 endonuclease/exonuclease/phosphatase family protein [Saprospiraceae bacterium]MCI1266474.1 endonuclease/exonuclease/phosphatase family protein [Saprospiraceae bacterium]
MVFFLAINIVWAICCVVLYLVVGVDPRSFWIFSISSLLVPASFFINLMFVIFWIFFKWRNAWISFILLLFSFNYLNKFIAFNDSNNQGKCKSSAITVMSYNVYGLKNLKDTIDQSQLTNKQQFTSFLRKTNPDVLCVQEDNLFADGVINKTGLFPYFHYLINHGAAIYSKHPILDNGQVDFGTKTNSCLWADLLIDGKKLRIYSVHLQSNRISSEIERLADNDVEINEQNLNVIRRMMVKYRRMSIRRAEQAIQVKNHAANSPFPVIIAGDFNDTPYSYAYEQLTEKRKDSFLECGKGIGSTFVGALPGLRIDFVLADEKKIEFCFHRVMQTTFSDHNPVFTSLYLKY